MHLVRRCLFAVCASVCILLITFIGSATKHVEKATLDGIPHTVTTWELHSPNFDFNTVASTRHTDGAVRVFGRLIMWGFDTDEQGHMIGNTFAINSTSITNQLEHS